MTNSPTFDQQLTLNAYWDQIGGNVMLRERTAPPIALSAPHSM